jgi:hypothetical protein
MLEHNASRTIWTMIAILIGAAVFGGVMLLAKDGNLHDGIKERIVQSQEQRNRNM